MKIVETLDGSTTLVSDYFDNQLYHSDRGALGETKHVYIPFIAEGDSILEVGFGSGLNALEALRTGFKLHYTTIEFYPVDLDTITKLSFYCNELKQLHEAPWNETTQIDDNFTITKLCFDFETLPISADNHLKDNYDKIFFDAFAPDVVPNQWSEEIFATLYNYMNPNSQLLTYCAKGVVKRAMRAAGLTVKRLPGALGKHNMVQAIKGEL